MAALFSLLNSPTCIKYFDERFRRRPIGERLMALANKNEFTSQGQRGRVDNRALPRDSKRVGGQAKEVIGR